MLAPTAVAVFAGPDAVADFSVFDPFVFAPCVFAPCVFAPCVFAPCVFDFSVLDDFLDFAFSADFVVDDFFGFAGVDVVGVAALDDLVVLTVLDVPAFDVPVFFVPVFFAPVFFEASDVADAPVVDGSVVDGSVVDGSVVDGSVPDAPAVDVVDFFAAVDSADSFVTDFFLTDLVVLTRFSGFGCSSPPQMSSDVGGSGGRRFGGSGTSSSPPRSSQLVRSDIRRSLP